MLLWTWISHKRIRRTRDMPIGYFISLYNGIRLRDLLYPKCLVYISTTEWTQWTGGAMLWKHWLEHVKAWNICILCASQLCAETCLPAEVCFDAVENHLLITVWNVLMGADFFQLSWQFGFSQAKHNNVEVPVVPRNVAIRPMSIPKVWTPRLCGVF